MLTTMKAQEMQFSDSAVISLLTCSPGQEIYAKFGTWHLELMIRLQNDLVLLMEFLVLIPKTFITNL